MLSRWGGEEFVIALPHTSDHGAFIAAERLRQAIAGATVAVGHESVGVTVSIGAATYDREVLDVFIHRADEALYAAKQLGRNRVSLAAPPIRPVVPAAR
jgi:diguanylate cyclase (GGDEF)-like protein